MPGAICAKIRICEGQTSARLRLVSEFAKELDHLGLGEGLIDDIETLYRQIGDAMNELTSKKSDVWDVKPEVTTRPFDFDDPFLDGPMPEGPAEDRDRWVQGRKDARPRAMGAPGA